MRDQTEVLLTVRCLTYNHAPYIRRCLEGLVGQKTNFRFEVMVHDDASTDGTADIVREFAQKYPDIIKPILETENLHSKRDGSLERVTYTSLKGKYIAWCEGDDYWTDEHKLQKQVDFLEQNPDFVLACTDYALVDDEGKEKFHNKTKRLSEDMRLASRELVLGRNPIIAVSSCFRKGIMEEYRKWIENSSYNVGIGDYPMWIYFSTKGRIKHLDEKMVAYRVLEKSASHSQDSEKMKSFRDNTMNLAIWMNKQLGIGVNTKDIKFKFSKMKVRDMAKFSKRIYCKTYLEAIRDDWRIAFDGKLWAVSVVRLLFNKKC